MSKVSIKGYLRLFIDGVEVASHHNQVTFLGAEAYARALQGMAGYNLTSFEAGTGTSTPTASDTALDASTHSGSLASYNVLSSLITEVTWTIPIGAIATQDFTEFGLFCANGDMFARWCDGNTYSYVNTGTLSGVWTLTLNL